MDQYNYEGYSSDQPEGEQDLTEQPNPGNDEVGRLQRELEESRRQMSRQQEDLSRLNTSAVEMAMMLQKQQQSQQAPPSQPIQAGFDWNAYFNGGGQQQAQQQNIPAGLNPQEVQSLVQSQVDQRFQDMARVANDFEGKKARLVKDFWDNQKDLHQVSGHVEALTLDYLKVPNTTLEAAYDRALQQARGMKSVFKQNGNRSTNLPGGGQGNPSQARPKADTPYPLLGYMDGLAIVKYSREDEHKDTDKYVAARNDLRAKRTFNDV